VPTGSPDETKHRLSVGVGDTVVYAAHGVGRVVAREQKQVAGTERECLVVDLATGLRVTLSVEEAAERLRATLDDSEFEGVRKTLSARTGDRLASWTKRVRESKDKLASGRATELAEIVRDGSRFEQAESRLSHGERLVYLQARELLVRELCSARGLDPDEAEAWIDSQIARDQNGK
jgi:CarD family transcriptional regulator